MNLSQNINKDSVSHNLPKESLIHEKLERKVQTVPEIATKEFSKESLQNKTEIEKQTKAHISQKESDIIHNFSYSLQNDLLTSSSIDSKEGFQETNLKICNHSDIIHKNSNFTEKVNDTVIYMPSNNSLENEEKDSDLHIISANITNIKSQNDSFNSDINNLKPETYSIPRCLHPLPPAESHIFISTELKDITTKESQDSKILEKQLIDHFGKAAYKLFDSVDMIRFIRASYNNPITPEQVGKRIGQWRLQKPAVQARDELLLLTLDTFHTRPLLNAHNIKMAPFYIFGRARSGHIVLWVKFPRQSEIEKLNKAISSELHIAKLELAERCKRILRDQGIITYKHVVVLDLRTATSTSVGNNILPSLREQMDIDQKYYSESLQDMIILVQGWAFKLALNTLLNLLDKNTRKKIHLINSLESLDQWIKPCQRPDEFCGIGGGAILGGATNILNDSWK